MSISRRDIAVLIAAIAIPFAVFFGGIEVIKGLSNREIVRDVLASASGNGKEAIFLNRRLEGYAREDAFKQWGLIAGHEDGEILKAELLFLKLDLAFPVAYCGALMIGLLLLRGLLPRPPSPLWFGVPVTVALLADWTENGIHLQQLARFDPNDIESLQSIMIQIASAATSVKYVLVLAMLSVVPILALWILWRRLRTNTDKFRVGTET